jgi:hypothetical protein
MLRLQVSNEAFRSCEDSSPPVEVLPTVTLTNDQMRGIFIVTVLLMPGLIAFAGGAMWWLRR